MRFLRFICNVLLLFVTSIFVCALSVGVYDLVACQDNFGLDKESSIEVIHVIPADDTVSILDTYTFWGNEIASGAKAQPKYRIRNWGNDWWREHMKWADVALDTTIAVIKPIFVPIAQVNAVKDYYLTDNYDINAVYHRYASAEANSLATDTELYEMYVIFADYTYGDLAFAETIKTSDGGKLTDFHYAASDKRDENIDLNHLDEVKETTYMRWAKKHKNAYNIDWKLQKYNQPIYTKYFRKFVFSKVAEVSKRGQVVRTEVRTVKSSIVVLYYVQLVSFALALVFVIKYPVALLQARFQGRRARHRKQQPDGEAGA